MDRVAAIRSWFIDYFEAFREYEFLVGDVTDVACYRLSERGTIIEFHTFGSREAAAAMLSAAQD